ncbi:hypothetical protein RHECNPAF_3340075 [Rhizobium etli CNPAF512]|nr:hypothetical protein RHECNPAF_3340075 [Rhizobium etli CNPAF512]
MEKPRSSSRGFNSLWFTNGIRRPACAA